MKVDFKITTWERVEVSDEIADEVQELIKKGDITTANDLIERFDSSVDYCGKIDDVDEQMTVEENGGCSTVEVLDDKGVTVWHNGEQ